MPEFHFARARKKDGEKPEDYRARILKDEAEAREAVATFVLGLTAEFVPAKSLYQPSGDRLAEVKGRQILEKYNCNGCHLIRPGVYDFKPGEKSLKELLDAHDFENKAMIKGGEIVHRNHINWVGRNSLEDKLRMFISRPQYEDGVVGVTLNEALRFENKDKKVLNIPAGATLNLQVADLGADSKGLKSQDDFDRLFYPSAQYGGAFANLLAPFLVKKDKARFPADADARGALPPSLVGQGERTQPKWLKKFLLDPTPVRRLAILRMPKFNLSEEEADVLVAYFAAVTRQTNPGIGLTYGDDMIVNGDDYWRKKTADYVKHLKANKQFDSRVKAYEPVWERVKTETEALITVKVNDNEASTKKTAAEKEAIEKKLNEIKDAKDPKKLDLDLALATVKLELDRLTEEKKQLAKDKADLDPKVQQAKWETEEAYAADAYRMLTSRELCTKCHQVGNTLAASSDPTAKQGPPLDVVFDRLRPDWIERWVDKPQRFVPYQSLMIAYFNKDEDKFQNLHAGPAHEQIRALRDVLLNYRQVSRMPINAVHNPDRR
jgi:cbb3-type cytochrome oxidase cytochrome c subunit